MKVSWRERETRQGDKEGHLLELGSHTHEGPLSSVFCEGCLYHRRTAGVLQPGILTLPDHISSVFPFVILPQILGFSTPPGRLSMMSFILNALTCALGLLYFIRRGKQCLDFTVTVHFFHLLGCWFYSSRFPSALTWWLVQAVCIALMAVIGEYLCMRTELKEIPLNSAPKSNV